MNPIVFDRPLLAARRRRALATPVAGADFLLDRVADDLAERLTAVTRPFATALAISPGGTHLASALAATGRVGTVFRADVLVADPAGGGPDLVLDEEALPFADGSLDLVVAALSLQAVNDLPGALVQIRRALRPDGLFLAALAGRDTLGELRTAWLEAEIAETGGASPRVAPFADVRDLGGLLQRAGFALPVTDVDRTVVRYADAFGLYRDLRALGATNALAERSRRPTPRALVARASALYAERSADTDGRLRATVEIVSLSGWAPHESQQKPLRPGSARARLADALGAREVSAGEKAGG